MNAATTPPTNLLVILLGSAELSRCTHLSAEQCAAFENSCKRMYDYLKSVGLDKKNIKFLFHSTKPCPPTFAGRLFFAIGAVFLAITKWLNPIILVPMVIRAATKWISFLFYGTKLDSKRESGDEGKNAIAICNEITAWLNERTERGQNKTIDSVLVYFVGHGDEVGDDYCLMVYDSNDQIPAASTLKANAIAHCLENGARHLRHYLIIDACMSGLAKNAEWHTNKGAALLSSTTEQDKCVAVASEKYTRFSGALLDALEKSVPHGDAQEPKLSFEEMRQRVELILKERGNKSEILPQVPQVYSLNPDAAKYPEKSNVPNITNEPLLPRLVGGGATDKSPTWDEKVQNRANLERWKKLKKSALRGLKNLFVLLVFFAGYLFLMTTWPTLYHPYQDQDGVVHFDRRVHRLTGQQQFLYNGRWMTAEEKARAFQEWLERMKLELERSKLELEKTFTPIQGVPVRKFLEPKKPANEGKNPP